jgi:uncharacterized membrane protein (UPF0127 family)
MCLRSFSLFALLNIGVILSCKDEKKHVKQTEVSFKKEGELTFYKPVSDSIITKIDIEIADSDYEIQTGLMYRDSMKLTEGMLFVFEDVTERYFYMKNTRIPLDLIFIDADKTIVSFQKNAKPFDESSLESYTPAKYVLEVNAGMADSWRLVVGNKISYASL